MFTHAFASAVLRITSIYAKVSKCNIWKRTCAYYSLGILLLLIFQVISSNTDHWGVMKLCFPEENLLPLVSPSQWFQIVQLPFHLTSLLHHCTSNFSPAAQWLHRLFKVFQVHAQFPEDLLQHLSLLLSTSMQHFQEEISVLICYSV